MIYAQKPVSIVAWLAFEVHKSFRDDMHTMSLCCSRAESKNAIRSVNYNKTRAALALFEQRRATRTRWISK